MNFNSFKYHFQHWVFLCICLLGIHTNVQSQSVHVSANPYKNSILIGEEVQVDLTVVATDNKNIVWPNLSDTLNEHVEINQFSKIDTLKMDTLGLSQANVYKQKVFITSFDSGLWAVPPFVFSANNNHFETEAFLLEVNTVKVDTTQAIKDIKDPYELPMTFMEYVEKYWMYGAGVLALALAIFLFLKFRKPKDESEFSVPEVVRPPHEIALQKLDHLKQEALWQAGDFKTYHIRLSDIIREYLEKRFEVSALESTTDDIQLILKRLDIDRQTKKEIIEALQISDLAKFAKAQPIADENEFCFNTAYKLVTTTVQVEPESTEEVEPPIKE